MDSGLGLALPLQCFAAARLCPRSRASRTASARPFASSACPRHSPQRSPALHHVQRVPSHPQQTRAPHPASPKSLTLLVSLPLSARATRKTPLHKSPSPCSKAPRSAPARQPVFLGISGPLRLPPARTSSSHSRQRALLRPALPRVFLRTTAPPI